jgi:hypothetical protein
MTESQKTPTLTLAQVIFIPLIEPHIKKPLFGKPRLPLANFLTVGAYLYETGAVLGWAYRDNQLVLERVMGSPKAPGKLVRLMRSKAKERTAEAKSEDEPLALLVYKTQAARLGHPMDMNSTGGLQRFANWVKKQSLDLDAANAQLQVLFAEGVGYGFEFPEETQRRWRATYEDYEKQEHILSWREMYQDGIVHNPEPPTQTWDERVSELKDVLRWYITEFMPELRSWGIF